MRGIYIAAFVFLILAECAAVAAAIVLSSAHTLGNVLIVICIALALNAIGMWLHGATEGK